MKLGKHIFVSIKKRFKKSQILLQKKKTIRVCDETNQKCRMKNEIKGKLKL